MVDLNELVVGDTISFTSINPTDNVLWQGTITGICSYDIVQNMRDDLVPYYRAVKKVLHTMEPIDKLQYFTIRYTQGEKIGRLIMAKDWIEPSSIQKIILNEYFDIRIYDLPKDQAQTIVNLLQANGFKNSLV